MLREQEAGSATADVCRKHGISPATFYQWKSKSGGFAPGGARLHSQMSAHGPNAAVRERARTETLAPFKLDNTLAFMFETSQRLMPTELAMGLAERQPDYDAVWDGLAKHFNSRPEWMTGKLHFLLK